MCCLVAIKINAGLENVVVGVYFFPEMFLVADSSVELALPSFKAFVVLAKDEDGCGAERFHHGNID